MPLRVSNVLTSTIIIVIIIIIIINATITLRIDVVFLIVSNLSAYRLYLRGVHAVFVN